MTWVAHVAHQDAGRHVYLHTDKDNNDVRVVRTAATQDENLVLTTQQKSALHSDVKSRVDRTFRILEV